MSLSNDRQQQESIYLESGANKSHCTTVEPIFIGRSGFESSLNKPHCINSMQSEMVIKTTMPSLVHIYVLHFNEKFYLT